MSGNPHTFEALRQAEALHVPAPTSRAMSPSRMQRQFALPCTFLQSVAYVTPSSQAHCSWQKPRPPEPVPPHIS